MKQFYDLISEDISPVTKDEVKCALKITNNAQDNLLLGYIAAATKYGENYTGRSFRDQEFNLLLDEFPPECILLRRSPVNAVVEISYTESDNVTAGIVDPATYYLAIRQQSSEIWLNTEDEWPSDVTDRKQNIVVKFTTTIYAKKEALIKQAIQLHVANMYYNRGDCDCDDSGNVSDAGAASGANSLYDQFRISRV